MVYSAASDKISQQHIEQRLEDLNALISDLHSSLNDSPLPHLQQQDKRLKTMREYQQELDRMFGLK